MKGIIAIGSKNWSKQHKYKQLKAENKGTDQRRLLKSDP